MATNTRKLAALLGASGAGIADAGTINTAGITADAIDNTKIADNAVNADSIAANAVGTSEVADNVLTATDLAANSVGESELSVDYTAQSVPHIIPGVLYPAVAGKLLDGTTSHSGNYGTAQSDGRSYYYSDIKGSKPIKDPRIGGHFGSQRHKFKSRQLLEQETATHADNVYSVDGREWVRLVGSGWTEENTTWGNGWYSPNNVTTNSHFFEIVGYFSDANISGYSSTTRDVSVTVDGGTPTTNTGLTASVSTPLDTSRYVDAGSLVNLGLNQTLGIHTLKIGNVNGDHCGVLFNVELIAQNTQDFTATNATNILTTTGHTLTNGDQITLTGSDLPNGLSATTTYYVVGVSGNNFQVSTSLGGSAVTFSDDGSGTRTWTVLNNIQIPSQNVVSYGKKFNVSGTPHYNPFNNQSIGNGNGHGKNATGWTTYDSTLDTATSLGLGAWVDSGNYYRPVNGGRIVKWVDSSGNIKTSVNMMPPTSICPLTPNASAGMEQSNDILPTGTNWTSVYQPVFGGGQKVGNQLLQGSWSEDGGNSFDDPDGSQTAGNNTTATIIGNGTAWVNSNAYGILSTPFTTVEGRYYKVEVTNVNISGTVKVMADTSVGGNTQLDATLSNGTDATYVIKADSDLDTISIQVGSGSATITRLDVAVYEIEDPSAQAEVAKTFHFREFGNGSANGNASYRDMSTLDVNNTNNSSSGGKAFVMDDGLTSLSGVLNTSNNNGYGVYPNDSNDFLYLTFIGTGLSFYDENDEVWENLVQNLPYGTHIFAFTRDGTIENSPLKIDGVTIKTEWMRFMEFTFHQPKRPPIPEDAVILADYMLTADFVKKTADNIETVSKGVRKLTSSRGCFFY